MCKKYSYRVIVIILLLIGSINQKIFSQSKEVFQLESVDSLESSLQNFYGKLFQAEFTEWEDDGKGRIWLYLPDVGIQFGLPSVNLSTRQIKQAVTKEKARKKKIESIRQKLEIQLNKEVIRLRQKHKLYTFKLELLQVAQEKQEIRNQIFEIYEEAYSKKEMDPLEYLKHNLEKYADKEKFLIMKNEILEIKGEIEYLAKYNLSNYRLAVE